MKSVPPRGRDCVETQNPTHGSGWIIQIQPTRRCLRNFGIPPTEVGGLFRSGLQNRETTAIKRDFSVMHSANVDEQVGSEQSTNSRWWDSRTRLPLCCRPDLNHPPTPVGGISEFSHSRVSGWVLTSWDRDKRDWEQHLRLSRGSTHACRGAALTPVASR